MTALRTHAAALIDRVRGIGRGLVLVQRRRRAPDGTDVCDDERLLAGLDLLRDLQRAEERVAFGERATRGRGAPSLGTRRPSVTCDQNEPTPEACLGVSEHAVLVDRPRFHERRGAAAKVRIVMSESRADMPPRRLASLI